MGVESVTIDCHVIVVSFVLANGHQLYCQIRRDCHLLKLDCGSAKMVCIKLLIVLGALSIC
jgi:hypothetical protein